MTPTLSTRAQAALVNAVGRRGAPVREVAAVIQELFALSLVSRAGKLTARGVDTRQCLLDAMLEVEL